MSATTEYLYRYKDQRYSTLVLGIYDYEVGPSVTKLVLHKYPIIKRTPKGVWIDGDRTKRFVLLTARKQFACETIQQALTSFLARKRKQQNILAKQLQIVDEAIELAHQELKKL